MPEIPSLTAYLADALHVDLHNYLLHNLDEASRLRKQEQQLHERRVAHEREAALCSLLLHEREKILRVIRLADPQAAAAGD